MNRLEWLHKMAHFGHQLYFMSYCNSSGCYYVCTCVHVHSLCFIFHSQSTATEGLKFTPGVKPMDKGKSNQEHTCIHELLNVASIVWNGI